MDTRASSKIKMDTKPLDVPGSDQNSVGQQSERTRVAEMLRPFRGCLLHRIVLERLAQPVIIAVAPDVARVKGQIPAQCASAVRASRCVMPLQDQPDEL